MEERVFIPIKKSTRTKLVSLISKEQEKQGKRVSYDQYIKNIISNV